MALPASIEPFLDPEVLRGEIHTPASADGMRTVALMAAGIVGLLLWDDLAWHAPWTGGTTAAAPSVSVIWERFPKFVLGFIAASLLFSFVVPGTVVGATKSAIGSVRTLWFALAFVSIGLETRLTDLLSFGEGRPLTAFLLAQSFNLVWTLLLAFAIFGGWFVAVPLS